MADLEKFKIMFQKLMHVDTCRFSSSILMRVVVWAVVENQSKSSSISLFVQKDTERSF